MHNSNPTRTPIVHFFIMTTTNNMKLNIFVTCLLTAIISISACSNKAKLTQSNATENKEIASQTQEEDTYQEIDRHVLIPAKTGDKYGYINQFGKWMISPQFSKAESFNETGLAYVSINGKARFIDSTGKAVFNSDFQEISPFKDGYAHVKSVFCGYIDSKGNFAIEPKYEFASDFTSNGLARVNVNGLYGYIDKTGNYAIEPKYTEASDYSENGLTDVKNNGERFLIDSNGDIVAKLPSEINLVKRFHDGRAVVRVGSLYGFIDATGKIIIEAKYRHALDFSNGMAAVKDRTFGSTSEWGFIDTTGTMRIQPQYFNVDCFAKNGLASVSKSVPFMVIDRNGRQTIEGLYDGAVKFFEDNMAVARQYSGKVGWIDKKGKWVLQPKFDALSPLSNGLAAATLNDKSGYINRSGNWIIKPKFDNAYNFTQNGVARVEQDGKFGYIDKTGNYIAEPKFDDAHDFADNGLALVTIENEGYIDTKGNFVTQKDCSGIRLRKQSKYDGLTNKTKYGYEDCNGNFVIKPQFDSADDFSDDGMARVAYQGKYGVIDTTGKYVLEPTYEFLSNFSENGMALIKHNGKYGYINTSWNIVIEPQYENASNFSSDGLASVKIDGKWGFINSAGKMVIAPQYENKIFPSFVNGLASVEINNKNVYIDKTGAIAIEPKFDFDYILHPFSQHNIARFEDLVNRKYGLIDRTGKVIYEPQSSYISYYEECRLFAVDVNGWHGFIDSEGNVITPPSFSDLKVRQGVIFVKQKKSEPWGIINRKGDFVAQPQFDEIGE